ncbi:methyltransferase-like protein 24 [Actinia tenebrosa]|uniref:Methyltransferase-like protein 24 n=1 Tax=Actinia tenebrosa TaxID=6105 RepID=A0A6P8I941_ACTTE|nr:methyltransferase-like protein 24 [Actinia tenebrosa]
MTKTGQTSNYQFPTTAKPINIYKYIEQKPAGNGTIAYEMARYKRFLATQGAVCQDIRRIGGERSETTIEPRPFGADGAWDVCFDTNVGLIPGSCIVYSFGIGRDFSFDDGMANYGCHVFSFDPTIGQPDHRRPNGVEFFNIGLSSFDQEGSGNNSEKLPKSQWKTRTLASVINELGHEKGFIDIVKMDIEGDEWKCLRQMLKDGTLRRYVRQLSIELHLFFKSSQRLRKYYSIARWLHRQGIKVSSLHQNPYCPDCLEINFINTRLPYDRGGN